MANGGIGTTDRPLRVAVVGAGPSGFYAIQALFKARKKSGLAVEVDLIDRLPTPFGLVRGGVAPDHPKIKSVIRIYDRIAHEPGFRFFGNVRIGADISVAELAQNYDQVVYAVGNETDRKMGLPGEDLEGVYSATEFVGWYNGHPDFVHHDFKLPEAKRAAVVGIGNVAIDVARIIGRNVEELAPTDIASYAVDALRKSTVVDVLMYGRRGPAQAAFSPKEIKELGSLEGVDLVIRGEQLDFASLEAKWLEAHGSRDANKNVAYLNDAALRERNEGASAIHVEFLASPVEFIGENGKLTAVRLERNELYDAGRDTLRPKGTGETWVEPCDLVFKAIGYRGIPLEGIPFHESWGIFHNRDGRLFEPESDVNLPGHYVVGWAKRGPSGLIGSNNSDSAATVAGMLEDLEAGITTSATGSPKEIEALLSSRSVRVVTYADWETLDKAEVARGQGAGKIREKFTSVAEMLSALDG